MGGWGGAATQTFAPGGKYPRAATAVVMADVRDVYTDYARPMCRVDAVDVYRA